MAVGTRQRGAAKILGSRLLWGQQRQTKASTRPNFFLFTDDVKPTLSAIVIRSAKTNNI
jgi:hypothetical protein